MKMHLFVADEDRDELRFILEAIAALVPDFKCTYATSSVQAVEMLKYLTPDFILVDHNISDQSGLDVLESAKKNDRLKDIPFFVYTDKLNDEIRGEAIALGVVACFEKPDSLTEATAMFKEYFQPVEVS